MTARREIPTFEDVYRAEYPRLLRRLMRRVAPDDARDFAQEAFARLHHSGKLPVLDQPGAYLNRIARNMLIDRTRRQQRTGAIFHPLDEGRDAPTRPLPNERPLTEAEKNGAEIADTVQIPERLAGEPELTRQVWILFHLYGRSFEEIARRLGISRRRVERLRERADYATIGMSYPSFGERIRFELMTMRLGLECRWDIFRSVFYG